MSGNAWINPTDNKEYVYLFGGTTGYGFETATNNIDR